jgi:hypothetical protein
MERYVFPPTLDFVRNTAIDPFAMYIFEFEHKFDKNDLSHMWQNLPPKAGRRPTLSTSIVEHNLKASELMGDWKTFKSNMESGASKDDSDFYDGINDNVQWMVFKVKQKAKTNYYDALSGKEQEAITADIPTYTDNWPYDFCSIVELAKLDAEVQLGGEGLPAPLFSEVSYIPDPVSQQDPGEPAEVDTSNLQGPATSASELGGGSTSTGMTAFDGTGDY